MPFSHVTRNNEDDRPARWRAARRFELERWHVPRRSPAAPMRLVQASADANKLGVPEMTAQQQHPRLGGRPAAVKSIEHRPAVAFQYL